jgi:hypothetical protein
MRYALLTCDDESAAISPQERSRRDASTAGLAHEILSI